jgi:hypothetical protein
MGQLKNEHLFADEYEFVGIALLYELSRNLSYNIAIRIFHKLPMPNSNIYYVENW